MFNTNKIESDTKIKISEETRKEISNDVEQCYKDDVQHNIYGKKCWKEVGITFETLSKITVAAGGVLSYSSGYFNSTMLSFVSGSISVLSLALLHFCVFSYKQAKKSSTDLNIFLKKLDLETVPVIDYGADALSDGNEHTSTEKNKNDIVASPQSNNALSSNSAFNNGGTNNSESSNSESNNVETVNNIITNAKTNNISPNDITIEMKNSHFEIDVENSFRKPIINKITIIDDSETKSDNSPIINNTNTST